MEGEGLPPTGVITFLFTDVVGSTRLWANEPANMVVALERHDEIVRGAIEGHGGYVFTTAGDAFCAAFSRASDAVAAAVEAQDGLLAAVWPGSDIAVRMGLHLGEADERGGDYFGQVVSTAARIEAASHGGQIVLSDAVRAASGVSALQLGLHQLRGVSEPVMLFQVGAGTHPALNTTDRASGVLPSPASSFVGRSEEIAGLVRALNAGRIVSLVGVGGAGKTRLAIEAAGATSDDFSDGVWFVDLATVGDPDAVVDAVAAVLQLPPQPDRTLLEALCDGISGRQLLVVMDNCEHVLEAAAEIVRAIAETPGPAVVLATSREPLGVAGEQVRTVPPLTDAVELFEARASEADADFMGERALVEEICSRLDGLPLAIELAAARVRSLTLEEISDRLSSRFRLLRGSGRGAVERHQTLAATVQWSFDLLAPLEQQLFERLSVFGGSFDVDSVEAVCADDVVDQLDVIDLLTSLVDKSMVVADRSGPSTRYRLLETMRQFAEEHMSADDLTRFKNEHLDHFSGVFEALTSDFEDGQLEEFAETDRRSQLDWANLRMAMLWALSGEDTESSGRLLVAGINFANLGLRTEAAGWARRHIDLGGTHPAAYGTSAFFHGIDGDFDAQVEVGAAGLRLHDWQVTAETQWLWGPYSGGLASSSESDPERVVEATRNTHAAAAATSPTYEAFWAGVMSLTLLDEHPDEAPAFAARAEELVPLVANPVLRSNTLAMLARYWVLRGDLDRAIALADGAVVSAHGSLWATVRAQTASLFVATYRDDDVSDIFHDTIATCYDRRFWFELWPSLESLASWWVKRGELESAGLLIGLLDAAGVSGGRGGYEMAAATRESLRADPRSAGWIASGEAMTRDQGVAFALETLSKHNESTQA